MTKQFPNPTLMAAAVAYGELNSNQFDIQMGHLDIDQEVGSRSASSVPTEVRNLGITLREIGEDTIVTTAYGSLLPSEGWFATIGVNFLRNSVASFCWTVMRSG